MASSAMLTTTETAAATESLKSSSSMAMTEAAAQSAPALQEEDDDEGCKDNDELNSSLRSCSNDPNFAIICAFLQKFAKELGLELPNFKHLQEWLTNTDELHAQIRDLHIKLLRKTRKTVHEKSWESALSKFCFTYSAQDGWEVERFGYKQTSLKVKLRILRELLESQFERNTKFRNKILTMSADSLRSQPIGRDRLGHSYWLTQDNDCNLRIYQEHLDEEIWQVVATNRDELVNLITRLRGNEVVLPSTDIGVVDEDSSSNSCNAQLEKPPPPVEQDDSQEEETKVPSLRIRIAGGEPIVNTGKGEEELAVEEDTKLEDNKPEVINKAVVEQAEEDEGLDLEEEEEDESGEEEDEEEEEEEEEEEQSVNEVDKNEGLDEKEPLPKYVAKNKAGPVSISAGETEKKVKPLLISNVKLASSLAAIPTNNGANKKRPVDEMDKSSPRSEDSHTIKKFRPSLLDSKREKKPSRYEKVKSEDEDDDDGDEEDDGEEEEFEEEDGAEIDEIEDEGEEEDIDSAAAEEGENEQKDIEDDDDDYNDDDELDGNKDAEVSEAIEDPAIVVHGEGSGEACEGQPAAEFITEFSSLANNALSLCSEGNFQNFQAIEVGEAVEEQCLYIIGEGYGSECLVGNKNNEDSPKTPTSTTPPTPPPSAAPTTTTTAFNEPKAKFFFGEPGCLKLSPMKNTPTTKENENDAKSTTIEEHVAKGTTGSSNNRVEPASPEKLQEDWAKPLGSLKNCDDNDGKLENNSISSDSGNDNNAEKLRNTNEDAKEEDPEDDVKDKAQTAEEVAEEKMGEATTVTSADCLPQNATNHEENNTTTELESIALNGKNARDDLEKEEKEQENLDGVNEGSELEINKNVDEETDKEQIEKQIEKPLNDDEDVTISTKDRKGQSHPLNVENEKDETTLEVKNIANEEISKEKDEENATLSSAEEFENKVEAEDCTEELNNVSAELSKDLKEDVKEDVKKDLEEENADDDLTKKSTQNIRTDIDKTAAAEEQTPKPFSTNVTSNNNSSTDDAPLKGEADAPLEVKIPSSSSSLASTTTLPNRKRRLSDLPIIRKFNIRQYSTSESELDFNAENSDELPELGVGSLEDEVDDNVGGKRLKMRNKITNSEIRKKVEAQKIAAAAAAAVEETTSSSSSCGEEDALNKRKMVSSKDGDMPASKFTKAISTKEEEEEEQVSAPKLTLAEEKKEKEKVVPLKQKPTLDEIIEKKLKKSAAESLITSNLALVPTLTTSLIASIASTSAAASNAISSEKKSPVTKPLKKNLLLTQLRQDESDEETIPSKRTVSVTKRAEQSMGEEDRLSSSASPVHAKPLDISGEEKAKEVEQAEGLNTPKRLTPDRQRKRRSSEEIKQTREIIDVRNAKDVSECVGEKVKRSDTPVDSLKCVENKTGGVFLPSLTEDLETAKEKKECLLEESVPEGSNIADEYKSAKLETTISTEMEKPIVEMTTAELKEEKLPAIVVGRRSSRRGGATVLYAELPQPKRTRGSTKVATVSDKKIKQEEVVVVEEDKLVDKQTKSETKPTAAKDIQSPSISDSTIDLKKSHPEAADYKDPDIKIETEIKFETKIVPPVDEKKPVAEVSKEKTPVNSKTTPTTAATNTTGGVAGGVGVGRGRGRRKREVDTTNIIETADSETPVRQSRRIAQQKIREEAERRKLEEIALRSMKNELKKKKKAQAQADPTVPEPSEHSSSSDDSEVSEMEPEETKKSKKKKCPGKDGTWSSGSEEQEEPEEEEEPPHYETDPGSPLFRSDHEFSPESDLEDESQIVPMKRARTARKEDADSGDTEELDQEEEACQKCGKSDHPEWILLCDNCDKGYHCSCLSPVLFYIPEGDWYCPPCQQEKLIVALEQQLNEFDNLVAQKRLEEEQAQAHLAEVERAEKQRLEEEENRKKKKKKQKCEDGDDNESDENDPETKNSTKESDDDELHEGDGDGKKSSKKSKKGRRDQVEEKRKHRDYSGGNRRRRRRAAKRGARQRRRNEVNSNESGGSGKSGDSGSQSGTDNCTTSRSSSSSSSSETDSDDEPIYKLRKRRQINVSYRLNEYDDLINSALKKEMDEAAIAGNLGRGKDIKTIVEAGKEEQARQFIDKDVEKANEDIIKKKEAEETAEGTATFTAEHKPEERNKCVQDKADSEEEPLKRKAKTKSLKKKPRKLTTLDISSEEDNASDEDFKGSSLDDEDDEDTSVSITTNSDSSLEVYKRRNKNGKKTSRKAARHAARERRRVRQFVVEDSDDDEEEQVRPKTKKKRKTDSDYSETEESGDEFSELSENMDSADLCDDSSSSEDTDGPWRPSKNKKQRKSNANIARKSPKLKKPQTKKPKRVEYSDDDVSEDEEEDDYDDYDDFGTGGKGSGKQPRTVPLKICSAGKGKGKGKGGGAGAGKSGKASAAAKKKKKKMSDYDEDSFSDSEDSTRRTRGRRYAYLEDFEDESSDGGIKPGVKRPDTPPEEREKFIKKQEEIKRMLAEKNAEGAKLAATPRLTPIKGGGGAATGTPAKSGDSLSTVPPSVIRQAKVLDIDYLQRKGESVSDVDNVDEVDSEFDEADLPDDFPEDMDEDAIARMVEEEEGFSTATTSRELSVPDEVLKSAGAGKTKPKDTEKPPIPLSTNPSLVAMSQIPTTGVGGMPATSASGLQEPMRKRLPMPTIHPPLLRHQYPGGAHHHHHGIPSHLMQRHPVPPTHLLQNALSAPLSQAVHRNFPQHPMGGVPSRHGGPARTMPPSQQHLGPSPPLSGVPVSLQCESDSKPRGRRKKITPLRDPLQKQQAAAAVTAATAVQAATTTSTIDKTEPSLTTAVATGVIKTAPSLASSQQRQHSQQPPQQPPPQPSHLPHLYKAPLGSSSSAGGQPSVITRMPPHLPPLGASVPGRGMPLGPPGLFAGGDVARFYGPPVPLQSSSTISRRPPMANAQRQRGVPHVSVMPTHHALRPSYGPPPPLRGVASPGNQPPPTSVSGTRPPYPQPHGDHHSPQASGPYGPPPPARHAAPHLNPFRPSIFGNPNFVPRGAPPGANMRSTGPTAQEYSAGPPRTYAPYGYYPPPPPLTAAHQPPPSAHPAASPTTHAAPVTQVSTKHPSSSAHPTAVPSSVIVSAPPSTLSLAAATLPPALTAQKHTASASALHLTKTTPPPPTTSERDKSTVVTSVAAAAVQAVDVSSPSPSSASQKHTHTATVVVEPRKKLITLETYATSKSPLAMGGESSGSRSSPNVQTDGADDSSSTPVAATSTADGQGASEFSGLVSYFSSQHDDYNT